MKAEAQLQTETESSRPPLGVVACRDLTKCYDARRPDAPALRGVDLVVEHGEMVAIMGPSGCGKSTLLHLLGGLDVPTSGGVFLLGRRFDDLSEAKRAVLRRRHVGYVFQFFNLITNLTVEDNVELPMLLAGCKPREARERRQALLDRLGVGEHAREVTRCALGRAATSASRSRARWPTTRPCFWRTSRPATWTARPPPR